MMPTPISELVDELRRLKPGSPALRHFTDIADGAEWWNALSDDSRRFWLEQAGAAASVADAWAAYKRQRAFARLSSNVVALLKRGEGDA